MTSQELNYVNLGGQDFPVDFSKTMLIIRKVWGFKYLSNAKFSLCVCVRVKLADGSRADN